MFSQRGVVIHAAFAPMEEVAHARRIIAAFRESTTGLVVVDSKLVEKPVVREMERILLNAGIAA